MKNISRDAVKQSSACTNGAPVLSLIRHPRHKNGALLQRKQTETRRRLVLLCWRLQQESQGSLERTGHQRITPSKKNKKKQHAVNYLSFGLHITPNGTVLHTVLEVGSCRHPKGSEKRPSGADEWESGW